MRGQGRIFHPTWTDPKTGTRHVATTWRLDYSVNGKRHLENAHTTSKREALALLHQRLGERRDGRLVGAPDRVTFADLRELAERQYALDGRRSGHRLEDAFNRLSEFFGAKDTTGDHSDRAVEVTPARLDEYAQQRLATGRSRSCVNYELACVRRAFRLAIEKGLLATMPVIKLPRVHDARQGFFEDGPFAALVLELPPDIAALVKFLRFTGWRRNEALGLTWDQVDREGEVIRLSAANTKGGDARLYPYGQAPELKQLLDAQWAARDRLFVFHRRGARIGIGALRSAWTRATKRAGLEGMLLHDLRRTAARAFRRAGVSEGEIMRLCGWKTRSMFDRYNIIDEQDLAAAVAKRFNGQVPSKSESSTASSPTVTSSAAR